MINRKRIKQKEEIKIFANGKDEIKVKSVYCITVGSWRLLFL
jgi:hypothetical protein